MDPTACCFTFLTCAVQALNVNPGVVAGMCVAVVDPLSASIAIDLQSMIEDNHVGFTRDELSYVLNNVCTT